MGNQNPALKTIFTTSETNQSPFKSRRNNNRESPSSSQINQSGRTLSYTHQHYSNSNAKHDINHSIMNSNQPTSMDKNKLSVPKPEQSLTKISHCRIAFVDLNEFYRSWRSIPRNILLDALLILPKINSQWILKPDKYLNEYSKMLWDDAFIKLLQLKYQQGLVFCNDNIINKVKHDNEQKEDDVASDIDPFWQYLSNKLKELEDPVSFGKSNYNPLILKRKFYDSDLFHSKYDLSSTEIMYALKYPTKTNRLNEVIQDLLFQCNPSLKVVIKYSGDHKKNINDAAVEPLDESSIGITGTPTSGRYVHNIKSSTTAIPISEESKETVVDSKLDPFWDKHKQSRLLDPSDHTPYSSDNALIITPYSNVTFVMNYESTDTRQDPAMSITQRNT